MQNLGQHALQSAPLGSSNFSQHLEPSGLERGEIVARALFGHRPIERRHVAATVAIAPFDEPMAATFAIGVNADD
jgi:hypothetical protein